MIDFVRDCIYEASTDKDADPYAMWEVLEVLMERFKFKNLGSGAYARVMEHPDYPGLAVKIEHRLHSESNTDTSNFKYMNFVMQNQHLEWVPKVFYSHQNFQLDLHGVTVVSHIYVMEKLNPVISNTMNLEYDEALYLKAYAFQCGVNPPSNYYSYLDDKKRSMERYKANIRRIQSERYPDLTSHRAKYDNMFKHDIARARKGLYRFFVRNQWCTYDLQMTNMMLRPGTNQIVFTDPAA